MFYHDVSLSAGIKANLELLLFLQGRLPGVIQTIKLCTIVDTFLPEKRFEILRSDFTPCRIAQRRRIPAYGRAGILAFVECEFDDRCERVGCRFRATDAPRSQKPFERLRASPRLLMQLHYSD
ncbi:MAG: hypothetical protein DI629_17795 [Mesorhizobium amorphae]|nr:MAG: hypothetical protein DI629_17795 [Mesorhizobium amorphae]